MAKLQRGKATSPVRIVGWGVCRRTTLRQSTALRAAALVVLAGPAAAPAFAQVAANVRPAGGAVVGGQARISQNATTTTIDQTSQQAAINWQSFNVGSKQTVTFDQPNSRAVALNTVVGPNPSEIAGRITANGQVVIVNQSGVVFDQGSQVDTAGLVVSAAGITTKNFMAGHMVFDQAAHAGARVVNNGTITIRQAGLAALVAPQVANAGLIQARLGRVILGGAATYTLDLYGDGLLALNVTGQVTNVSLGGRTVPALVTNSGIILADGGTIMLSAAAADGLIRTLVTAGGTIAANSVGSGTGRVLVQGIGGSVEIDGAVSASGVAQGTSGGQVVADATGGVAVNAGAVVDASGDAGGGVIALGTTAARALGGAHAASTLTASSMRVAAGARLAANAGRTGNGGHITLLSTGNTSLAGAISVLGGSSGGNGGAVELSGLTVGLTGFVNAGAAHGHLGGLLIDPQDIYVASVMPTNLPAGASYMSIASINAMNADVTLSTNAGDIDFAYTAGASAAANTINIPGRALTVTAGISSANGTTGFDGNVNVDAGITINAAALSLTANGGAVGLDTSTGVAAGLGAASIGHAVLTGTTLALQGDTGISLGGATLTATSIVGSTNVGAISLVSSDGSITEDATGVLNAPQFSGAAGSGGQDTDQASLVGSNNVGTITSFTTDGDFRLTNAIGTLIVFNGFDSGPDLTVGTGHTIELVAPIVVVASSVSALAGTIALQADNFGFSTVATNLVTTGAGTGLVSIDSLTQTELDITSADTAPNIQTAELSIGTVGTADTANLQTIRFVGGLDLTGQAGTLGLFTAVGGTVLESTFGTGTAASSGITVTTLAGNVGNIALTGGTDRIASIGDFTALNFALADAGDLNVTGTVNAATSASLTTSGSLTVTGLLTAGTAILGGAGIDIAGTVSAPAALTLNSTGGISEPGGITTSILSGSATGSAALTGTNAITALGNFTAAGLTLTTTPDLTVTGAVNGGSATSITDAGTLTVVGSVTGGDTTLLAQDGIFIPGAASAVGTLSLSTGGTTGDITATGPLTASLLTGVSDFGTASFTGANAVTRLSFNSQDLTFTQAGDLNLTGASGFVGFASIVSGGVLTIDGSLEGSGVISLTGASVTTGPNSVVAAIGSQLNITATAGGVTADGTLRASTLAGSATGAVALTGNIVFGTLGGFTAGSFTLDNGGQLDVAGTVATPGAVDIESNGVLTVSGNVTGTSVLLSGGFNEDGPAPRAVRPLADANATLIITGSVVGTATTTLTAAGDIVETGQITTALLTGTADGLTSLTGSNLIAGLGDFNTAAGSIATITGFTLDNVADLAVSGTVSGGQSVTIADSGAVNAAPASSITADSVSLQGASLGLAGQVNGPDALSLIATAGGITEIGSLSTTAALTGSATGAAALTGSNTVGTLGNFVAQGFSFAQAGDLVVAGTVNGGASAAITSAGSLTIGGQVTAAATTLSGANLTITGSVTGSDTLGLTATAGGITATEGTLTTALLSGAAESDSAFLDGTNAIGSLGNFSAGELVLNDTSALAIVGTVTSPAELDLTAPSMTLAGNLTAQGGESGIFLTTTTGTISQTAGAIATGFLDIASAGATSLPGANAVNTLDFNSVGSFAFNDTIALNTQGQVTAAAGGAPPVISLRSPALTLEDDGDPALTAIGGTVGLGTDTLTLDDAVDTGTTGLIGLTTYASTTLTLNNSSFAQFTTGELSIGSLDGVTPSPQVTAIVLPAGLDLGAHAGTLGLFTAPGGTVTSTMGITAGTLVGNAGTVSITGPNAIDAIGNFTAQDFTFSQPGAIAITGALAAAGSVAVASTEGNMTVNGSVAAPAVTLSGLGITIPGSVTGTATLGLTTLEGDVTETGSLISALLTGSIAGDANLTGSNSLSGLGSFTANDITLSNGPDLSVSGAVSAVGTFGSIVITTGGTLGVTAGGSLASSDVELTAAAIGIDGTIQTGDEGNVSLTSTGGDIDEAGSITSSVLSATAVGNVFLTGNNAIQALYPSSATGSFVLEDGSALEVVATVNAGSAAAPARLALVAPAITVDGFGGALSAPGGTLTVRADELSVAGSITTGDTGLIGISTFSDSTLTLSSAEIAAFTTGTLYFGSVGAFQNSLLVSDIVLNGAIDVVGHASTLGLFTTANGTVSSAAGITAGTLTGVAGTVSLTGPNVITSLGNFTAQDFTFAQAGDVTVGGNLNAAGVALSSGGLLTVSGSVNAPTAALTGTAIALPGTLMDNASLTLTATAGSIAGTGAVTTPLLLGSATGSVSLTGANRIGGLGSGVGTFNASGLTLNDLSDLAVTGVVTAGATTSITDAGTLSMIAQFITGSATLTADAINLGMLLTAPTGLVLTTTQGGITETGAVDTNVLTGSAVGSVSLTGTNGVGALGNFASAGFSLVDEGPLNVTGTLQGGPGVAVTAAGMLTVSGGITGALTSLQGTGIAIPGSIAAATSLSLTASSGDIAGTGAVSTPALAFSTPGSVTLVGANSIAALGNGSANAFTLTDDSALTVSGGVAAPVATLTAPAITVTGSLMDTGSLTLIANAGDITGGGQVAAGLLAGSATGSLALTGANQIGTLGSFAAAGFNLQDNANLTVSGTVAGGGFAFITNTGSLTVNGGIDAATIGLSGTTLLLPGSIVAPSALTLTATQGDVTAGNVSTAMLSGSAAGLFSLVGTIAVPTLGDIASTGFSIGNDTAPLTVSGVIQGGPTASISDAGALTISGDIAAGTTSLQAASITVPGTIATAAPDGLIQMYAPGTITVAGSLTAPTIQIGAALQSATTQSAPVAADATLPAALVTLASGTLEAQSISITADSFQQIGVTRVNPDGGAASIAITLGGTQGTASFNPIRTEGLIAPTSSLSLGLGFGTASGNVDVEALTLTYSTPVPTTVSRLTGAIGGVDGMSAASHGVAQPAASDAYLFNGCILGAATCGTIIVPPTNTSTTIVDQVPIFVNPASGGANNAGQSDIDYGFAEIAFGGSPANQQLLSIQLLAPFGREDESRRRRRHDDDLIIPNISSEDF